MPTIKLNQPPITATRLRDDLATLGVEPGMTLTVHSSLSAIGWVVGGAPTVVQALLTTIGEDGTLAMPAATPHCTDPATWSEPQIPTPWLDTVRDSLPIFDPRTTPTEMGVIPETFRTWPGTLRSSHPIESVCAHGPLAAEITRDHPLAFSEGPGAPFDKLHDLKSWILLLGTGFNRCTALHFAESLVDKRRTMTVRFPAWDKGQRVWFEVPNVADDNDQLFPSIGKRFVATGSAKQGTIGEASSTLFPMHDLVSFATEVFEATL